MMDGQTVLYFHWYLVINQYVQNNGLFFDPVTNYLLKLIGFAAEIDFYQKPRQSDGSGQNPFNPPIDNSVLSQLRTKWLDNNNNHSDDMRLLLGKYFDS